MSEKWRLTYDGDHQEDEFDERPSEFVIRQTRRACPDSAVRLWRLIDGWNSELAEEYEPLP